MEAEVDKQATTGTVPPDYGIDATTRLFKISDVESVTSNSKSATLLTSLLNDQREQFASVLSEQVVAVNKLKEESAKQQIAINTLTAETRDKISNIQTRSIEALGIFVSLFTFISTSFQVVQSSVLTAESAVGLILIVGGMLIVFVLVLHLSFDWQNVLMRKVIAFTLIVMSLFLILYGINLLPIVSKMEEVQESVTTPTPTFVGIQDKVGPVQR